ncbi:hypothetical protein ADEAN_000968100 [Angomonas deanei]|uniref:C3H1-type domain-containing protein n=1 Tax=Angomonas deanei TaxID=59799 RepID=A0A7G2CV16_9TRYP|nr:hypothetical protein ADEAN_000968100 [Angomonas deanei]
MDTMTALTQLIQEAQERSELTRALHGTFDFSGDDANFLFSSSRTTPATTPLPVCFSDSVRYYYSLLNDPTVPLEEAPYIFEDMLRDPALFSRVEYSPMSSFSDMLRDTASKWWFLCARKILQRATENSANPSKQDEEPTDCVERGKLNQDYHNIRSVLLLVLALLRPYSSMSLKYAPVTSCTSRLMLCRDPSITYIGLILNSSQPTLAAKVLRGMPVQQLIALSWRNEVTLLQLVTAMWTRYKRQKRVLVQLVRQLEDGESLLQEEAAIEEEEVMEEVTPSLSVLSTDPYQYLPKEKLKVEPKNGSSGESEIDLTLVCRVCLESMNEYRQDLTMLLWWARCRLLSYAQLPGTMQEEVLVETDFFYDIIHCKDIFKEILKEKDCVQRKKMNRVMENYQKARKQGSAGYSDVENTSLALVQAALQAYDDTYASLVGTIADTSFTWRRDKLLRRENGSRQSQANAFWSIIHTTVPHNDRFLRENFTSYESFWQFSLIVDYHITHVVSAVFRTTAGETSSILAQMLHLLKTRPEYYPHTILKVVGVYDLELSTIAFTMGLAPIAIELFYRYAPQMPLPPPKKELLEMSPAVEEEEEIQEEETVQTESEPHIVEGVTFIENEEEEAAIAEEISEASSDDDSFSLVLSPKSDEELRDEVRESSEVSTLTLEAYDTLVTVLLLFQTAIERGETSVNPLTFLLAPEGSPDKPDVITLLHAFMLQTRYPYLAAISTMGLAACAHHNISDMVPAYVERGIIESVFRILARPLSTRLYRELAEKEKAGLENDYTTLTEREAFYNSVLVKLMIPTLIQALTVHHMTHRAFRLHNRTCLSSIASAMRAVPDCFVLQKANEEYASRWFCHYVPPFGRDVNEIKQSPLEAFRHPQFAAAMERREKNTLVLSSKIRKLLTEEIRPLLVSSFRELQHIFTGFNEMAADVFSIHLARFSAGLRIKNDYDQWSDSSANTLLTRNEEDDAPDTTMTEGAAGSALQRTTIDTIAATYTMFNFFMFLEVPDGGRVQLGRGPEWEGVCTSLSEFVLEIVNLCPVASNGRDGSFDCSFLEIDSRVTLGLDGRRMEPNPIPDVYFPAVCALLHSGSLALFIQQSRRLCPSPLRSSYLLDGLSGFVVNIIQNLDPTTRALTEDQAAVLLPILEMLERLCRPNRIHKSILPSKSLYTLSGVFVQLFIMARYQEKNGQEAAEEEEEPDRAGRDVSQPGVTVVRTTIRVTETGEVQQTVGVVPRDAEFVRLPRPGGDMEDDVEEVDAMEREENNRSPSIDRSNNQNDENDRQANNADAPGASPDKKKGPEKQKSPFLTRNTDHLSLFFERLTKALWYNGKDRSRRSMVPSNNQMPGGCSVFIGAELLISQCERQMQQIMKKLEAPFEKYFNAPNSDELLSSDEKIEAIRRTILLEHLDIDLLKQISTRMIVVDTSQCLRSRDVKNLDNKMLYIIKRAEFISRLLYYKEDPQTKDKGKTNGNGDGTTENSINNLPGASENEKKKSEIGENEDTNVVSTDEKTEEEYKYRKQRAATALARIFYSMIHSPVEPNQRGMPPSFHSMRVMAPLLCITFNLWDHLEGFPRSRTMYMSAIQQITRRRGALLQISAPRRNVPAVERNNPRDLFPFLAVAQPHNRMMRHRFEEERDPERNMGARFDILPFFGDDVDLATEFTNNNDSSSPSTPPPEAPPVAPPAENVDENTKTLRDLFNVTANKYQSDKFDQLSDSYLDWIIQFSCNQYVNLESFSPEVQAGERRNCTAILHAVVKGEREDDRDSDPLSASGAAALTKMFSLVLKDTVVHYPLLDHLSVILSQKSQSMLLNVLANTPLPMAVVEKVLEAMEQVQSAAGEEDKKTKKKVRAMRATLYNFLLCFTAVSGHFGNIKQTTESTAEGHNQCKYFMEGYCRDGHQCPGVHVVAEHDLLEGMSGLFSKPADFKMRVTSVVKKLNDLLEVLRSLGYETKDGEDTVEDNNLDSNDDEKVGTTGEDAKEKESKKGPLPTLDPIRLVQSTISPSFTLLPPEPLQRVLEAIMADLLNTEEGSLIKEDASPTEGGPTERIAAAFPKSNCINWSWRKGRYTGPRPRPQPKGADHTSAASFTVHPRVCAADAAGGRHRKGVTLGHTEEHD